LDPDGEGGTPFRPRSQAGLELSRAATDTAWGIAAGLGRAWFTKPARARLLGRASGAVLIGGGVWLSLARRPA
jgi:homoserine/homoserine lactone efflux protein